MKPSGLIYNEQRKLRLVLLANAVDLVNTYIPPTQNSPQKKNPMHVSWHNFLENLVRLYHAASSNIPSSYLY